MNRIVNVTGFSYSGMSGIVDFLLEYGFFYNADGVETFQYDCSDGLFQLEDKLFATISGGDNTEAILRFREMTINAFYFKQVMTSTCRFFTDEELDYLNQAMDEFIGRIGVMDGNSLYNRDWEMIGQRTKKLYNLLKLRLIFVPKDKREEKELNLRRAITVRLKNSKHLSGRGRMFVGCTRDEYLAAAKEFIQKTLPKEQGRDMIYSHLIRGGSINRVSHDYFDGNIKSLVSWRDPRDQFIILKRGRKTIDANNFARYFRRCMFAEDYNTECCKLIRLEDLVFDHEKTAEEIEAFMDIKDLKGNGEKKYCPEESAHMGGLYLRPEYQTDEWKRDIEILEKSLPEYLYDWEHALKEKGWYDDRYTK